MFKKSVTLDELRMKAAASPTGVIKITIEQLNQIATEINEAAEQAAAPDGVTAPANLHPSYYNPTSAAWGPLNPPPRSLA